MEYTHRSGTATMALSGTTVTFSEAVSGELGHLVLTVPALTGTGTITVRGTQSNGGTLYELGTVLESKTGVLTPVNYPTLFDGTISFVLEETSGTQDAAADITYDLYYGAKQG